MSLWSNDPESYGSVTVPIGRLSLVGRVNADDLDKKVCSGPRGRG